MINEMKSSRRSQKATWTVALLAFAFLLAQPNTAAAQVTGSGTINKVPKWTGQTSPSSALGDSAVSEVGGNVGIGTTTPNATLEINKIQNGGTTVLVDNGLTTAGNGAYSGIFLKQAGTLRFIIDSINDNNTVQNGGPGAVQLWNFVNGPMLFATNNTEAMRITGAGNVGVGITNPTSTLHVQGTANITGAVSTGPITVNGDVNATGNIAAKYQDVAEWVPASGAISAGTVVVVDPERSNHVIPSARAYDTRVAGVVSASPGVILGEKGEGKVMVATTGRVKIKVDATCAPVRVGDLLVTSDKEGIAMRSMPLDLGGTPIHRPGTLIGKALEPLEKGVGEILVLLSLQ